MTEKRKCYLKSTSSLHPPLVIAEDETFFGRSAETLIQDTFCSRKQVSLKADFKENCVYLKQIGVNASALNGFVLTPDELYKGYHLDYVEILHNKHFHQIIFEPPPSPSSSTVDVEEDKLNGKQIVKETKLGKRKTSPSSDQMNNSKKLKETNEMEKLECKAQFIGWEHVDDGKLLIYTSPGVFSGSKIAAFDIDYTIIKTKSGNVFAKNLDDWQIAFSEVPGKLKEALKNGYRIVFLTNQGGIAKGTTKIADFKKKIERIISKLNVPIQVFISTDKGAYRKPMTGMWDALTENKNNGIKIELNECFYVGDAAGRPEIKETKRKKDHSLCDRLLAMNIGITFYTPEEYFQNAKPQQWTRPEFDPTAPFPTDLLIPKTAQLTSSDLEVIILVGFPGSGKSRFANTYFRPKGYEIINRDTLKSWQKCVKRLEECLSEKMSAVIDNTNGDKESRKRYITVANTFKAKCRCFIMTTTYRHAKHNIVYREMIDSSHSRINDMVINSYKKSYFEPQRNEGFSEIVRVNLLPKFDRKDHEKLYRMHLLE